MNRTTSLFLIGLLFLTACSSGSDFYKSSYPSYLKNGSTKKTSTPSHSNKISATERSENEFQFETKESSDNQVFSGGSTIQDSTNLKDNSGHLISHGTIEANGAVLYLPAENNDFDNHVALGNNQNDCPAITDLACQYLGDGIYMLTWSVPKIPIYTENGTLSEYRINRRTLEDPKVFVYKTPEPDCVDGTCTVIFNNLNNRTGYIWTVDTRCSRSTFNSSNSVKSGPISEPLPSNLENTTIENAQQNTNANNNDNTISATNNSTKDDKPRSKKYYNQNAIISFWLVPIMLVAGILTVLLLLITLFSGAVFTGALAGIILLAIIVGCIFSIMRGSMARKEIKSDRNNQKGLGLAIIGIVGSIIGLIISSLMIFAVIVSSD